MPTDPRGRRTRRDRARGLLYRRAVVAVVVVLAVACTGLGAWSAVQGPRLRSVATDPTTLITASGSQVVLRADQPIEPDARVTVEPQTSFDTVVDGAQVTLRFADPLDYAVAYRITAEVTSAENGRPGTLSTVVDTPDAAVYLLKRTASAGGGDELLRASLKSGDAPVSIFSARHIEGYASFGDQVVVLSAATADGSADSLDVLDPEGRSSVPLVAGHHSGLRRSDLGRLGWLQKSGTRADGSAYESNLFVVDPTSGDPPHEVTGFSGSPLSVADWRFIPGTDSVVVQDFDQQLYVIDTRTAADPTPLGRFGAITGFLPGSTSLVLAGSGDTSTVIDLATGDRRDIAPPTAAPPAGDYPGVGVIRDESSAFSQWNAADAGPLGGQRSSTIVLVDVDGVRTVVPPTPDGSWVDRYCLSPNGRYLSVQLVASDGRVIGAGLPTVFSDTRVEFVDVATGQVVRSVPDAADFDWCA